MSGPPKRQPWVWLTRDLLRSDAWQGLGINARRLIDFLLIEHMNKAGAQNGKLLAPRQQLEEFGIGARHVSAAIEEAVALGLVDVKRGCGRRASTYALTWLPLHDGAMPFPRWLSVMTSEGKSLIMTSIRIPQGYPKGSLKARSNLPTEVIKPVMTSLRAVPEGKYLLRRDLTAVATGDDLSGGKPAARPRRGAMRPA